MKIARNYWESEFFGREIGSLEYKVGTPCWRPQTQISRQAQINEQGRQCGVPTFELIQAKLPTTAFAEIAELQQLGFQLVETEVVFTQDFAKNLQNLTRCNCRTATESDLPALKTLMGNAFPNSRFRPPFFTPDENQRFYQQWIENAVKGEFDDICILAEQNHRLQGAVSLRIVGNIAKFGLLAVTPEYQGQGIAKQLIAAAIAWAKTQNAEQLEIRTQLSNLAAIRLYQSCGATISDTNYWFYR